MNIKNKVFNSFVWNLLEKIGLQLINLIVSLILVKILSPSDYGLYSLTLVLTSILVILVDFGAQAALIQKKDTDELDYSTIFWFNVLICSGTFVLVYFISPYVSNYFNKGDITAYVRVSGIRLLVTALKNVQEAYIAKNMLYKKLFFSSLIGTIVAGIVGIIMAICGYGIWSLVVLNLLDYIIDTAIICFSVPWKPEFIFSLARLKQLLSYGWKAFISGMLCTIYDNLRQLILGAKYSSADLACFDKGSSISNKIVSTTSEASNNIFFATFSNSQDNRTELINKAKNALSKLTFVVYPMVFGFLAISNSFVRVFFSSEWLGIIPFINIFCLANVFTPISNVNNNIINSVNKDKTIVTESMLTKGIDIVVLIISANYGAFGIACGLAISRFIIAVVSMLYSKRIINLFLLEQFKVIAKQLIISMIMAVIVYLIGKLEINVSILLIIQLVCGVIVYLVLSFTINKKESLEVISLIKNFTIFD